VKPVSSKRLLTLAVYAVIVLVVVVLFFSIVARMFSVFQGSSPSSSGSSAETSSGATPGAGELGVDVYPGARPLSDPDRRDSTDSTVVTQSFVSNEKMDLVINYYKARMVGQTAIYASGSAVVVSISPSPQESILVAIAPAPNGETRIAITHTTAKGSQ
jgi:hypothetical protein